METEPRHTLGELIAQHLTEPTEDYEEVSVTWYGNAYDRRGGELVVKTRIWEGGSSEYRGIHHPNAVCEGGGTCIHCGRTLDFGLTGEAPDE